MPFGLLFIIALNYLKMKKSSQEKKDYEQQIEGGACRKNDDPKH